MNNVWPVLLFAIVALFTLCAIGFAVYRFFFADEPDDDRRTLGGCLTMGAGMLTFLIAGNMSDGEGPLRFMAIAGLIIACGTPFYLFATRE